MERCRLSRSASLLGFHLLSPLTPPVPSMSGVPHVAAVGSQQGDVHMAMLQSIFNQNSQILAQNHAMNARLTVVEKEMEKMSQRCAPIRNRPRSKCADGFDWKCPVCLQPQKHLDSFLSHVRKFAIRTCHREQRERRPQCSLDLQEHRHMELVEKFPGDDVASQAVSFASHFLNVCRTISASGAVLAVKHARIFEWFHSITHDPNFSVAGECPIVSDTPSMGSGKAASAGSSSSDFGRQRVRLGGL